jgi:hypothetical protein
MAVPDGSSAGPYYLLSSSRGAGRVRVEDAGPDEPLEIHRTRGLRILRLRTHGRVYRDTEKSQTRDQRGRHAVHGQPVGGRQDALRPQDAGHERDPQKETEALAEGSQPRSRTPEISGHAHIPDPEEDRSDEAELDHRESGERRGG